MEENNYVMTKRGYDGSFKVEFDMEIQSETFGFNCNISIEGSTCEYHDKDPNDISNEVNLKIYFCSRFSDYSAKNSAPTF